MNIGELRHLLLAYDDTADVYIVAEEADSALPHITVKEALRGHPTDWPLAVECFVWVAPMNADEILDEFREEFSGADEFPAVIIEGTV